MPVEARIRRYEPADDKLVRFLVGKVNMEGLATANVRVCTNPLMIALWIGLSAVMIQYMGWWPQQGQGLWAYLRPLPAFAAMAVPLMFASDWYNRPSFEDLLSETMRRPDMRDIQAFYSRSPSSAFWLLELGEHVIGLIAIDASPDSTSQAVIQDRQQTEGALTDGTSSDAVVRHFFVEEQYRKTKIQDDLLVHCLKEAFSADPNRRIRTVIADQSELAPYIARSLKEHGFRSARENHPSRNRHVGILKWTISPCSLDRQRWDSM
ncbi:hypothetical protein PUNSTDRAFT_117396 [Punctularia strigosozonata HHB-11173 SS5]|uniref:uncharacterized protein n=1 Tax=Punctularia strigosozonata (strain HHB-11173) TaxID=741275 RepID=UPI0004417805|nr:uncharacterized protein PUNSTDRAFT_117396 [Punctularia strigosozonata HHB-11173 SS5]EIN13694.1 hypothetical protein PUNSTDRAFT_117396 [Punctularia strigosozonata HHB-11173 SS5]